jgi:hypothetical protein
MLSAGLSIFSKLIRNSPGLAKKVGVIGTGGLVSYIRLLLFYSFPLPLFSSATLFFFESMYAPVRKC